MIGILLNKINLNYNIIFLTSEAQQSQLLWNFLILALVVIGLVGGLFIFINSKNPENWEHKPVENEFTGFNKLDNLSILVDSSIGKDNFDQTNLKNVIEMMFFEKIKSIHGFSVEQLMDMKYYEPDKLTALINDKEISDWIFNKNQEKKNSSFLEKPNIKRQRNIEKINHILERMEVWGE